MTKKATATEALPIGAPSFPLLARDASVPVRDAERTGSRRTARAAQRQRRAEPHAVRVATLVLLTAACGWLFRDSIPLTPKGGAGYALGVAGGTTILLLATYPLRKNLRFMRTWGALSQWFRVHMLLGVVGPMLILFHCNFHLGAPNSNIALGSMLLVATSGVIGRYIYTRINHGLYGARATLGELHRELDLSAHTLGERLPPASRASLRLAAFTTATQKRLPTIAGRLFRFALLPVQARRVRRRVLVDLADDLDGAAASRGWDAETRRVYEDVLRETIADYLSALVKEAQFRAYERLASLWHALHVPLFVMLLLSGIMHVIAVHMY